MAARTKLLAVSPDSVPPPKPKVLIFGPAGVGKTWTALDFPNVFYIDTEGGAKRDHYRAKLKASGGKYLGPEQGSLDFDLVVGQMEALATEKHDFKTVVFDSGTKIFNAAISDEQTRLGDLDAFGASKKKPIQQMKRLIRWMNRADMNAIIIAHEKVEWGKSDKGQQEAIGKTFDCWDKLEYELDLVLRISAIGTGPNAKRFANVGKSRLVGFPGGDRFNWSYADFAERYGKDVIEKEVVPVVLATPAEVAEFKHLLTVVKLPDGTLDKWLTKAGAETIEEMSSDTIQPCIQHLKGKIAA